MAFFIVVYFLGRGEGSLDVRVLVLGGTAVSVAGGIVSYTYSGGVP